MVQFFFSMSFTNDFQLPNHHIKLEYCETRPKYRRGRRKTSVKVFTINSESKYLIVTEVPATGLEKEFVKLCSSHGSIQNCTELKDYPKEDFTQVFLVKYQQIQSAKVAKKKLDEHYFFGAMLHVFYAPEYETLADTREKIQHRRHSVTARIKFLERDTKKHFKKYSSNKMKNKKDLSLTNNNLKVEKKSNFPLIPVNFSNPNFSQPVHSTNIPCNSSGIPLFLPPPPPPPPPSLTIPPFSLSCYRSQIPYEARFSKPESVNVVNSVVESCEPSPRKTIKKSKPKLKQRNGYFYEKVLYQLKPTFPSLAAPSSSNRRPLKPMVSPSFLPRRVELKQLDDVNKSGAGSDGKVPLLGAFVHGEHSQT